MEKVYVHALVTLDRTVDRVEVAKELAVKRQVNLAYTMSVGEPNLFVFLESDTDEEMDSFILNTIHKLPGFINCRLVHPDFVVKGKI